VNKDRISELKKNIEAAKSVGRRKSEGSSKKGYHLLYDLIAGLTVGAFLGYNLDIALHTIPLFLFLFVILGICGGFYNFYKFEISKHAKK
jgi:ATP synthase protein I